MGRALRQARQDSSVVMRALMRYIIQDYMSPDVHRWIAEQTEDKPDDGPKNGPKFAPRYNPPQGSCSEVP
jgi:hypothetical protein